MAEIFRCEDCRKWFSYLEVNLKANDALVCTFCYLENPPPEDIDGVFAEVMAHMDDPIQGVQRHAAE
jgi:hypothetical protein